MDRLKKSLRESFRRKKGQHTHEASKPVEWQADELAVRSGTCNFQVKYLGCTEVFESRGMQVCEEAFKVLKRYKRKPMRAVLHVSGEALRVVDKDSKGLIVDQTIEKVSFCAPDRNYDRGFSYICRDGATRRWMCHGFLAVKYSKMSLFKKHDVVKGERLSHAVGCAFAACLERKQARDKECGVAIKFDGNNQTSFTRFGSFKTASLTDKLAAAAGHENVRSNFSEISIADNKPRELPVTARERPTVKLDLLRQASFRGPQLTSKSFSPFKKQLSLRLMELPSTLQRREEYTSKDDYLSADTPGPLRNGSDNHKVATISAFVPGNSLPLTNVVSGHEGVPNGYHPITPHPTDNECRGAGEFLDFGSCDGGDSIKRLCRQITQDFAPAPSSSAPSSTSVNGFSNGDAHHNLNGYKMDSVANGDATKITNPFLESHNILPGLGMMNGPTPTYPYNYHLAYRGHLLGTNANPSTPIRLDGRTAMVHPFLKSPNTAAITATQPLSNHGSDPVPTVRTFADNTNKNHEAVTKRNTNPFLTSIAQHPNLSYL